jgi:hypothetical protein
VAACSCQSRTTVAPWGHAPALNSLRSIARAARAGTWNESGFTWEDGSASPTELPSGPNNNVPGYSHWVVQTGKEPEPTGEACAYSDRKLK